MLVLTFLLVSLAGLGRALYDPNCDGKQVIVHLFEWKWTDVAYECERFLAGAGFCGVQVTFFCWFLLLGSILRRFKVDGDV